MWRQPPSAVCRAQLDCHPDILFDTPNLRNVYTGSTLGSGLFAMQRVNSEEILDSNACPAGEVENSLRDLCRINRWFGGIATTRKLIERVASATGNKHFSVLAVAAEYSEVSRIAG